MAEHDNWDSHWEHYADAASKNPAQQMRHRLIAKLLEQGSAREMRILDIGSGQGDLLVKLPSGSGPPDRTSLVDALAQAAWYDPRERGPKFG